mmetsp:Transcript_3624/g.15343  ORF Transcript_3624/g.15343 Transcript_3624/m.15343 type:complete len:308 (+) Transcript_3624:104-1027(+)
MRLIVLPPLRRALALCRDDGARRRDEEAPHEERGCADGVFDRVGDGERDGEEGHADRRRDEAAQQKHAAYAVAGHEAPRVPERDHRQRLALGLLLAHANRARLLGLGPRRGRRRRRSFVRRVLARCLEGNAVARPLPHAPHVPQHPGHGGHSRLAQRLRRRTRQVRRQRHRARVVRDAAQRGALLGAHQTPHHLLRSARDEILAGVHAQASRLRLLRGARRRRRRRRGVHHLGKQVLARRGHRSENVQLGLVEGPRSRARGRGGRVLARVVRSGLRRRPKRGRRVFFARRESLDSFRLFGVAGKLVP